MVNATKCSREYLMEKHKKTAEKQAKNENNTHYFFTVVLLFFTSISVGSIELVRLFLN